MQHSPAPVSAAPAAPAVAPAEPAPAKKERVVSLDVFRGMVIAAMIFMDHPVSGNAVPAMMIDSPWHGLTYGDLVFPSFLFIAGVAMAFSLSRKPTEGWKPHARFLWRCLLLVAIGLALNWYRYGLPLRIPGVLQRIGLACAIAYPFARRDLRWILGGAGVLMLAHSAVLTMVPFGGHPAGTLLPEANIAGWIDTHVIGQLHVYKKTFDPENLLGTITAAASVLLGVGLGRALLQWGRDWGKLARIALAGAALLAAGLLLRGWLPLNKHLWTATFVMVVAGLDTLGICALYAFMDRLGIKRGLQSFVPLGRNALALYIGSLLVAAWLKTHLVTLADGTVSTAHVVIGGGLQTALGTMWGSFAFSFVHLLLWFSVASALDQNRVYIKL